MITEIQQGTIQLQELKASGGDAPKLASLTSEQADFYHERFSIMLYEARQEFGSIDEVGLAWEVFRMAKDFA